MCALFYHTSNNIKGVVMCHILVCVVVCVHCSRWVGKTLGLGQWYCHTVHSTLDTAWSQLSEAQPLALGTAPNRNHKHFDIVSLSLSPLAEALLEIYGYDGPCSILRFGKSKTTYTSEIDNDCKVRDNMDTILTK